MEENLIEIQIKLNQLAEFQAQLDAVTLAKQAALDEIYTPEIKARINEIEMAFAVKLEGVSENIAALEAEIKQAVISAGTTVKGSFIQAVFTKGRVSWDTKSLDGYAVAHPELLSLRKVGEPSVSLRAVSK